MISVNLDHVATIDLDIAHYDRVHVTLVFALYPKTFVFNDHVDCDAYTELVMVTISTTDEFNDQYPDTERDKYVEIVLKGCEEAGYFAIERINYGRGVVKIGDVLSDRSFFIALDLHVKNGGRVYF